MDNYNADAELDARHLTCPLPILKAKKRLKDMAPGEVLRLLATDPNTAEDARLFADARGHEIVASTTENDVLTLLIRRGA
ncbi:MAG: sulfurtransferase TusA family protein [Pseudomonadota bacterium]